MSFFRASGILVHPTSFPSRFGIGDLGPEAYRFIEWIAGARQKLWQVLPLGPGDRSGSPYASTSAFAGNPLLISPEKLVDDRLLTPRDLRAAEITAGDEGSRVDYAQVSASKGPLLEKAFRKFRRLKPDHPLRAELSSFVRQQGEWLENHAMYMALSEMNKTLQWTDWSKYVTPRKQALRDSDPKRDAATVLKDRLDFHTFTQFLFFRQWQALRQFARDRGIRIIGDLPIYVAPDSADVWGNQSLFQLEQSGHPTHVAGVPPDYFSPTGQLWGNPLYDWDAMKLHGYLWWIERMRAVVRLVDIVRMDHFRGIQAYWSVPAGDSTAENGRWVAGPGADLFEALREDLATRLDAIPDWEAALPVIAEDLGVITPPVTKLRKQFEFPGMAVLQFAFGGATERRFLPQNIHPNTVAYTGTHDNDTTIGWFHSEVKEEPAALEQLNKYIPVDPDEIAWQMIEIAWGTAARMAVAPLQDVLSLDTDARMNLPGTAAGNWSWRYASDALTDETQQRLADVTRRSGRAFPSD